MAELEDVLKQHFGFDSFRPGQKELIQAALAGKDSLGILPTGSGKTLCYQLPGELLGQTVLVIEPLIALMEDQVARLQQGGQRRAIALSSRLKPDDFQLVLQHLNAYRFVFMAPETLKRPDVQRRLQQLAISLFVVDEAHCISSWGPDFRPAYLLLGQAIASIHPRAVMALTATAPKAVQADILKNLQLHDPLMEIASVDRPNIFLGVEEAQDLPAKQKRLLEVVQAVSGPQILYFDKKIQAEQTADLIRQRLGKKTAYYHAGLADHDRDLIQRRFMAGSVQVICATSAFGMGIDKADVRLVLYTYVPESLEAYSQGIGRAGRDGQQSLSLLLITPASRSRAMQFAQSLPDTKMIQTIFAHPDAYTDFDDPQVALVEAYIQAGFTQAQVVRQLTARLSEKQRSFAAVSRFLDTPGCLRAAWLKHFDSPVPEHTGLCCSQVTPAVLKAIAKGEQSPAEDSQPRPWQKVLAAIFNQKASNF